MNSPRLLSEEVLAQQGCYKRVRRYYEGWHPELGLLTHGWSGKETVQEVDVISPCIVVEVVEEVVSDDTRIRVAV